MSEQILRGKTALVTGASRRLGIGAAIARILASSGANVFLTYYRAYDDEMPWGSQPDDVPALLSELRTFNVGVYGLEYDLTEEEVPAILFEKAESLLGPVDILINNAAYSVDVDIDAVDGEQLDRHYAVNVRATILMCAEFVRRYIRRVDRHVDDRRSGGRIINITSGQGLHPMPRNLAYAATKGAIDAFTMSLSAEVADWGINVNAVDPGATDTGWMSPELRSDLLANSPKGRLGQPDDVARLVRFLVSDEAEWITGQILRSRGGM